MAGLVFRFPSLHGGKAVPLWIAVVLAALSYTSFAQQVHVEPRPEKPVRPAAEKERLSLHVRPFRVNVDLVLVPVTVTDAKNRPVTGLTREDFALREGAKPQEIRYFSSEDAPLSVGVLLDVSKSMKDKIELARDALMEFFNDSHPDDDYFVITFSDRPEVIADVTRSIGTIREKLANAKPAGHTALLDAIYLGLNKLNHARYQRKALLIISDGGDNHSRFTADELKGLVMESDVQIYGIGIYGRVFHTPEEWAGKRLLKQITEATGGRAITVGNASELPEAAGAISRELRNEYVLGYAPPDGDTSGWRKIKVTVTPQKDGLPMQVNWRRGYMAPGQ